jgi:hypothetical protein
MRDRRIRGVPGMSPLNEGGSGVCWATSYVRMVTRSRVRNLRLRGGAS